MLLTSFPSALSLSKGCAHLLQVRFDRLSANGSM